MEIVTLLAIVLGPFLGIWAHGLLEERKRTYNRKLDIFKTLMATRATPLSFQHVEALNRIDIEFTKRGEKKVRDAWTVYFDHLSGAPKLPDAPPLEAGEAARVEYEEAFRRYQNEMDRWNDRSLDRLANLLSEMSALFGYDFDEVRIKKFVYRPIAHGDLEQDQRMLLKHANAVLSGRRSVSMYVTNWPEPPIEQDTLAGQLIGNIEHD